MQNLSQIGEPACPTLVRNLRTISLKQWIHIPEAICYFQQRGILPNQIGALNCNIVMPQQQSYEAQEAGMPNTGSTNSFLLKWLVGTNVSRCYRCGVAIPNPLQDVPDDLVIVYRDFRRYRDQQTGQLQCTDAPQKVHFHLRVTRSPKCVFQLFLNVFFSYFSLYFLPFLFRFTFMFLANYFSYLLNF